MRLMKVLVTGGAGFIGSHIVDALIAGGHETSIVDDLSAGRRDNVNPRARIHRVDITDLDALESVFVGERPEIVNHHAAQTSVRRSVNDTSNDANVNIIGSINLLQLCVKYGVRRVLFASTSAVYSEPEYIPMDESHPIRPRSAYGAAKYAVENYVRLFSDLYGLKYLVFRYGNVYGPRQNPGGEAGVVAIFTQQLLDGTRPSIFGDGTKTRDYVFVKDIVDANILAMAGLAENQTFNLGRGVEVTDLEIFEAVRRAAGVTIEPIFVERRPGEAERVSLDSSKAASVLEWTPEVGLGTGVEQVVSHHLQQMDWDGCGLLPP